MQHKNKKTYIFLKFGFLYHLTLSSFASSVRMGSAVPSGRAAKSFMMNDAAEV